MFLRNTASNVCDDAFILEDVPFFPLANCFWFSNDQGEKVGLGKANLFKIISMNSSVATLEPCKFILITANLRLIFKTNGRKGRIRDQLVQCNQREKRKSLSWFS